MAVVPNITLNNGVEIPQLGFGVFQVEPEETEDATLDGARGRLPAHRHRGDVRQREGVGEAVRALRHRPRRALRHQQAQQRLPRATTTRCGAFDETLDATSASTTSTCSSSTGRCRRVRRRLRRDLEGDGGVLRRPAGPRRSASPTSSPTTCAGSHDETERRRRRSTRSRCTPTSPRTSVRAFDAEHGIATEAWSPIAQGKVLDDPTIVRDRRARSARRPAQVTLRWHVQRGDIVFPKSVTREPDARRTSTLFDFELSERPTWRRSPRSTAASAPAPTRTRSTTSRADPCRWLSWAARWLRCPSRRRGPRHLCARGWEVSRLAAARTSTSGDDDLRAGRREVPDPVGHRAG